MWNARTGKLARELPSANISTVTFSPDGRLLAVRDLRSAQFWNVGAWTPHLRVENTVADVAGCAVAFSQDGQTAAIRRGRSNVLLIDSASGQELGILETSEPYDITALCFIADDTKLVVAMGRHALRVWNLRRIRQHLSRMGLDWEAPPLPAQPSKPLVTSIKIAPDPPPAK